VIASIYGATPAGQANRGRLAGIYIARAASRHGRMEPWLT
jgi:hypothetical protein